MYEAFPGLQRFLETFFDRMAVALEAEMKRYWIVGDEWLEFTNEGSLWVGPGEYFRWICDHTISWGNDGHWVVR